MVEHSPDDRQRLDKWLWFARVVKTRSLAQKLVNSGAVRILSQRITQPAQKIAPGTVLTIKIGNGLRILRMIAPGERRGAAPLAALLFEDLTPEIPKQNRRAPSNKVALRDEGSGRPTKKQRRQTEAFLAGADTESD